MLQQVNADAWAIVADSIVPTMSGNGTDGDDGDGTEPVPSGTFTEGLLRNILDLCPGQQTELCRLLAKGKDRKGHLFAP